MGLVYLAHDPGLHRQVAVKVLRHADEPERIAAARVKRFLREARAAARLNDPHVVTIYTVGEHGGRPYLAMEYVAGGSLAEVLRRGTLGWRATATALRDACRGLAAAHGAGVIHRDIKPANLMRGADGRIKLVDFGLARAAEDLNDGELTYPGAFVGSPSYASPEQIAGVAEIDGRSDLYSLAATGFAMLAGQPPFVDEDPAEVMRKHLKEAFPPLKKLLPRGTVERVPEALLRIIHRASKKMPADRYASAAEMADALEEVLTKGGSEGEAMEIVGESRAGELLREVETTVEDARRRSDSGTELAALRRLVGLYTQLGRSADANRAFREALVIHVRMNAPGVN
jgi:serine/threonine protein kinase